MRYRTTNLLLLWVILLSFLTTTGCLAPGGIVPATEPPDIPNTWIATEGDWAFFRLVLRDEGTGMLAATFHDDAPMLYKVVSWQLGKKTFVQKGESEQLRDFILRVEPLGGARPLDTGGYAGKWNLNLKLAWQEWSPRWAKFTREQQVEQRIQRTKDAMESLDTR